jgi:hypothetical protein
MIKNFPKIIKSRQIFRRTSTTVSQASCRKVREEKTCKHEIALKLLVNWYVLHLIVIFWKSTTKLPHLSFEWMRSDLDLKLFQPKNILL